MPSSSRNELKTFAFTGIGNLGKHVIQPFLADASTHVVILTRDASKPDLKPYADKGAKLVSVDYSSEESLLKALQGVDVVVSTLGPTPEGAEAQDKVLRAGKKAGIKLAVPSEWGADYENPKIAPRPVGIEAKLAYHKTLDQEIQLPWLAFSHGLFATWALGPVTGFDFATRTANIKGDGKVKFTQTDLDDIGEFAHQVLTTSEVPPVGQGRVIVIEGYAASYDELLDEIEKQEGHKWTRNYSDLAPLHAKQTEPTAEGFGAWLLACFGDGRGKARPEVIENEKWGWTPKRTPESVVKAVLAQHKK